jgi:hypothetical protein
MSKKPISIILFHSLSCGHCIHFMPTWKQMKSDENTKKNILFVEYEASQIESLPEKTKTINGEGIAYYPTIKIIIGNKEYNYEGDREPSEIYKFILDKLKNGDIDVYKKLSTEVDRLSEANDAPEVPLPESRRLIRDSELRIEDPAYVQLTSEKM